MTMKKILATLSVLCFITMLSFADEPAKTSNEIKKETTVNPAEHKSGHSCCVKATKACCKNNSAEKSCTPAQKAACEKAGAEKAQASETPAQIEKTKPEAVR